MTEHLQVENAVTNRYSAAASQREELLCCPVSYEGKGHLLAAIPKEVIERDYGCGDPTNWVREGEVVLDLGSGTGKHCFMAAQVVGPKGRVIGVDMNDEMLALARRSSKTVGDNIGFHNVTFHKGKIQDLRTDRDRLDAYLAERPITNEQDLRQFEAFVDTSKVSTPMISDGSVDVVISNCVLNLVETGAKEQLFNELFRVLRVGGRAVISDIVSDELVPEAMQNDANLWSGCISGAFQEAEFLKAFERAGFYGIEVVKRDATPWQTVEGIEFRSVTVIAYKGKEGECFEHNEALIYRGPFRTVTDDDGHTFLRGEPIAVCRKTFGIYSKEPYRSHFYPVAPRVEVSPTEARLFSCKGIAKRHPRETKGMAYNATTEARASVCEVDSNGNSSCC